MSATQIDTLNNLTIGDIEMLHKALGLTVVVEDGRITTADYEGGSYTE